MTSETETTIITDLLVQLLEKIWLVYHNETGSFAVNSALEISTLTIRHERDPDERTIEYIIDEMALLASLLLTALSTPMTPETRARLELIKRASPSLFTGDPTADLVEAQA